MANYTWLGGSGDFSWGNAANWGAATAPTDADAVTIGVAGIQVTIGTGVNAAAYTLATYGSSLLVDGGKLLTVHHATFNGAFSQTSGTYSMTGTGATFVGAVSLLGGTVNVYTGALQILNGARLGGASVNGTPTAMTLTGAGVLELAGGSTYIDPGFVCKLNSIVLDTGAKLGFDMNFAYGHNITATNAVVDGFGHTLALSGTTQFSGVLGDGVINDSGTLTLGSASAVLTLDNGAVMNVSGTAIQANTLFQGTRDAGAKISVGQTGQYLLNGDWNITDPSSTATITNAGVFGKIGGGGVSQIGVSLKTTGTLQAGIGELQLAGAVNSIGGTVSGAGTLGIAGGTTVMGAKVALNVNAINQHSGALVLNSAETYANQWSMGGGVLNLNTARAMLTPTSSSRASLDGGVVTGYGGTINFNGATELSNVTFGGPNIFNFNGSVDQTGNISFGPSSNPVATIAKTATWQIEGDSSIQGQYGLITNLGLFADVNGSGVAQVNCDLRSSGTVAVSNSTLSLLGTSSLGGTLSGNGYLDLAGTTTLQAGIVINVSSLDVSSNTVLGGNVSDAGLFTEFYTGNIDTAGHTLSLSGPVSLDGGQVSDAGVMTSAGQTTVGNFSINSGATLRITGQADQNSTVAVGANTPATLAIAVGGNYSVLDGWDITGGGTVSVDGRLAETGTGNASIQAALIVSSTGTLAALDQLLVLGGGGSLAGTISGTGMVDFAAGTFTLGLATGSSLSMLSAGIEVTGNSHVNLLTNEAYTGDFQLSGAGMVGLQSHTLTLAGTSELTQGAILGAGVVVDSGTTTMGQISVSNDATLQLNGSAEQLFTLALGSASGASSAARLQIGPSGSYTLTANASVFGNGTLGVASGGTVLADGNGSSVIQTAIVDAGTIAANLGALAIQGIVTGSGGFSVGAAGYLEFSNTSTIGMATGVSFAPAVAGVGGTLRIDNLKTFAATLQNFVAGDSVQFAQMQTGSLSETFANAAHTAVLIDDGSGNQITLSFSTAQTLSALVLGAGSNGVATLTHH